ncbi:MAG TPA: hypothetical protein VF209_03295 [Patescibacteria group bacterium]
MLPEKQLGLHLNYSPDVQTTLAKMDEAHAQCPDESLMGAGLVELIDTHPTVVKFIATFENRLLVPTTFPEEIAILVANYPQVTLAVEPAEMGYAKLSLIGTQPLNKNAPASRHALLSFIQKDGQFKWRHNTYPSALMLLLEHLFSIPGTDLNSLLNSLLSQAQSAEGLTSSLSVCHTLDMIASKSAAYPTVLFKKKLDQMVASSGYYPEHALFFNTHYHPITFLDGQSVADLLRFSSNDIASFIASTVVYYQTRTVQMLEELETTSMTVERQTLEAYLQPINVMNSLFQEVPSEASLLSAAEVIQVIREYQQSLPTASTNGLTFDRVFKAGKIFYSQIVEHLPKNWTGQVTSRDQYIGNLLESIIKPGLYNYNLATLGFYHLNRLHEKSMTEQKEFDPSFLMFLEEADIFATVSAIAHTWVEAEEVDYYLPPNQETLPSLASLAHTPFDTNVQEIKKTIKPYLQLLFRDKKEILERHGRNFNVDLDKIKTLFEVE